MHKHYSFIQLDICDPQIKNLIEVAKVDYIINMAAESHVDRSIDGAPVFIKTEIVGTYNLLEGIRQQNTSGGHRIKRALFVGTDEVYGSIDRIAGKEGRKWYDLKLDEITELINANKFSENTNLSGGSPYSGCKGGADLLVGAFYNTFKWDIDGHVDRAKMPVVITRCVNNYGPYQHPEKLIPLAICTLLHPNINDYNRRIPIYDRGLAVREWIHTEDHANAIIHILQQEQIEEIYNIGSGIRCRNRDLLLAIYRACKRLKTTLYYSDLASAAFDATGTRPGHDLCYAVDCTKLKSIGWTLTHDKNFDKEIRKVVNWYIKNTDWWRAVWTSKKFSYYWEKKYKKLQDNNNPSFNFYPEKEQILKIDQVLL